MANVSGVDYFLFVNSGTVDLPVWDKVAGQRGASISFSQESLDSTTKDSDGWIENVSSYKSWSIDSEGLIVLNDSAFDLLETAFMNGDKMRIQLKTEGGTTYEGFCIISDLSLEFPHDDLVTWSTSLTGSGALTKTTV